MNSKQTNIFAQKLAIARNFSRAANTYEKAAILQQEVGLRLLDRLEFINLKPSVILDLGGGTGFFSRALFQKFPEASVFNLDIAERMLQFSKTTYPECLSRKICGDAESLPLKSESVDFIFSNCVFEWFLDPLRALVEIHRVLKPQGLILFSTVGPDTLQELQDSFQTIDSEKHVNHFLDMHNIGDLLLHTEFIDPVMDREYITLTYQNCQELLQDLKETGSNTVIKRSVFGLRSQFPLQKLNEAYQQYRTDGGDAGVLPATVEVVYGHAFANEELEGRMEDGLEGRACKQIPINYSKVD